MRKTLTKLIHLINQWQTLMWAGGTILAIGAPLVGWVGGILATIRRRNTLSEDDPEQATETTLPSPTQWFTTLPDGWRHTFRIIMLIGGLALLTAGIMLIMRNLHAEPVEADSQPSDTPHDQSPATPTGMDPDNTDRDDTKEDDYGAEL